MKKNIPCNNTRRTNKKDQNRIVFEFVTEDNITASSCTVRIGDKDPMTGETITNMEFYLKEYYKLDEHQVRKNVENIRAPYPEKLKEERERLKQKYIREFKQDHGYLPSKDDIRFYLEQKMPENYQMSYDAVRHEDGEPVYECGEEFLYKDEDPFECDLPDCIEALRETISVLPDRLKDVYAAMLQRTAGGAGRITFTDIAKRYNVSPNQIKKDRQKIEKIIVEKVGPKYQK